MSDVLSPTHSLTLHNEAGQPYTLQLWLNSPQAPTLLLLDGDWLQDCIQHFRKRHANAMNIASLGYGTTHAKTVIQRAYDFTPPHPDGLDIDPRVKEWKNGGAPAFSDFLEKTLLPTLAQHIDLNSSKLGLFGHSYAGLYALYLWLQQRPLFDQYVVASPSVWWRWPYLHKLAAAVNPTTAQAAPLHILLGEQEQWHPHPQQPGKTRPPGEPTLPLIQAWLHALPHQLQPHCQLELCPQMAHGPMLAHSATIALDLMRL